MSIFSKLFRKKDKDEIKVGGANDNGKALDHEKNDPKDAEVK